MAEHMGYNCNYTRCALSFCKNTYKRTAEEDQLSFFRFPEDPVRCAIWVENCDSKYLPNVDFENLNKRYKLCSVHFEHRMFNFQKNRLLSNAVPTLFKNKPPVTTTVTSQNVYETITIDEDVPPGIPVDARTSCSKYSVSDKHISKNLFDVPTTTGIVKNSVSLQTPNYLSAKSPRKLKLKKQLAEEVNLKKQLEKTVNELKKQLEQTNSEDNCLKLCEMYLPSTMYMLVKNYLSNKNKTPNGQRHLNEITQFAHTVHHLGPKAYYFLQKHFTLPHMRTLRKKTVQNVDKNIQNIVQNDHRYSKI
ncbi:uncharacterized protein LOC100572587 [Acyrthosiphon pisum]|uniref:THAP-type domain-containing protein n=1 Tax=Acyrthosiphon pisum TaxID=7029 RepID=A0A8R2AFL7_ACYPI|nr:uncharacterized protein LOC100572587 [Acyrthosiphon pisum]|eukprot:XP_003241938.1 PREDICTED: uncharacterized protein LOC100572587 [Acyrthosiphon pisum]